MRAGVCVLLYTVAFADSPCVSGTVCSDQRLYNEHGRRRSVVAVAIVHSFAHFLPPAAGGNRFHGSSELNTEQLRASVAPNVTFEEEICIKGRRPVRAKYNPPKCDGRPARTARLGEERFARRRDSNDSDLVCQQLIHAFLTAIITLNYLLIKLY